MCLKINWFVKTPRHRPSMGVARSCFRAPGVSYTANEYVNLLAPGMLGEGVHFRSLGMVCPSAEYKIVT